jgi:uncharacterized spore protein YtfJ
MLEKGNFNVKDNIDNLMKRLEEFIQSKTVIGEPMQIGEVTLVPLISASFGLGSGGGDGQSNKGEKGVGGGSGVAAKINPLAVLVIKGESTELITLKNSQALEKLVDKIPDLVSKVKDISEKSNKEEEEKKEEE